MIEIITEETLLKFGFKRELNQDTWFGRACWNKGDFVIMYGYGCSSGFIAKHETYEFNYVHQLEDAYFISTGQKLERI